MSAPEEYRGVDEELEELKRRKMEELQRRIEEERRRAELQAQKRAILNLILTPEARRRLDNLRLVKPELVEALENQLIALAQSGRLRTPIGEEELKQMLEEIYRRTRRDLRIRFR
ncbi:MAG: DNA-binding protein [Crenarchaeota archaeon]|jgi:programmed cell death protein 5|nr:DNA-binding protein [Thermoproteota archaeon]